MSSLLSSVLHFIGSYSLLIGLFSQIVVLAGAWKSREKPAIVQALLLIGALGLASASIKLRPHSPPQLIPDLLGCGAAALLFAPAVEAVRKMWAAKKQAGEKKPGEAGA